MSGWPGFSQAQRKHAGPGCKGASEIKQNKQVSDDGSPTHDKSRYIDASTLLGAPRILQYILLVWISWSG